MKRRILIADSDPSSSAKLEELFSRWGHRCVVAADSAELSHLLSIQPFDLAVVDLSLSYGAMERILREIKLNEIPAPVIVIADDCAEAELSRIERSARALGAAFFFVKPFDPIDFRAVCNSLFAVRDRIAAATIIQRPVSSKA